ncbi:antibiotic biosynthesis monooxygenase [Bacillus spongiae]|uniref:Antibiotic biosynthesis monooxygenase n=1 Tax=Bacillus spongiae TaxID=2683610 RepID=A0ABU8HE36_9BACI
MLMVTNNIKIKKGHAHEVAERFKQRKGIQESPGFIRMQLLISTESEEHDLLKVGTVWENEEAFTQWTQSDSFKKAHGHGKRGEQKPQEEKSTQEKIMLGAYLTKEELVYEL